MMNFSVSPTAEMPPVNNIWLVPFNPPASLVFEDVFLFVTHSGYDAYTIEGNGIYEGENRRRPYEAVRAY